MAQYEIFPDPEGRGFLLDVQSDLLEGMNVRAVVPLLPQVSAPAAASRLNPTFEINGDVHVMMTQYIAAVPVSMMRDRIGDLSPKFDVITSCAGHAVSRILMLPRCRNGPGSSGGHEGGCPSE